MDRREKIESIKVNDYKIFFSKFHQLFFLKMEEEDRDSFQEVYSRYTQYDWPFDEKIQIYSHCRKKF